MKTYLGTLEAADYLGIKERKLYELVATGAVPCSKVTGKWLFPRAALDRWVEAGLAQPHGLAATAPPAIIAGSHDPLLEWAIRRSGSGLALLAIGSEAGLARVASNEVAIAAIHLHVHGEADANVTAVAAVNTLADAVVLAFARREAGLLVAPGNPLGLQSLQDAVMRGARFGFRQKGAGAQLLLHLLLAEAGLAAHDMTRLERPFATGEDLAFAVKAGEVDCGLATRSVANLNRLDFIPLVWEHFDLVMRRRTYFEPGPQALLGLLRQEEFHRHAAQLGGFDTSLAGTIRLTR